MFDENESSVNAETEGIVEPQENEVVEESTENVNEEVVSSQENEKPVQTQEENSKFASMRRQMEQEYSTKQQQAIDKEYERLYSETHDIHSKADYDRIVAQQERDAQIQAEAETQGVSEDVARRIKDLEDLANTTKAEKAEYQRQLAMITEHETLTKDETFSDYYNEHVDEIKESAKNFKVDLTTAMLLSIKDNFKSISSKAEQKAINSIIKNGKSSPGSISQGGEQKNDSIYDLSNADFKKMQNEVMNGTRKNIN